MRTAALVLAIALSGCAAKCLLEMPSAPLFFDWDARPPEERERFREPIARCDVSPARPFGE